MRRCSSHDGCAAAPGRPDSTLRCGRTLLRCDAQARAASTARRQAEAGAAASPGKKTGGIHGMTADRQSRAMAEIAFCESVLAKSGLSVLSETFRDTSEIRVWDHFPPGDVFDPASGAQWYYHCHPAAQGTGEHGHFHCFLRPDGTHGPIHHLAAVGVDAHGRILRLFTVNQWVVGDDWLDAAATIALLPRFDVQMPRPSYLVNRWLTGVFSAYETEIAGLISARDETIAAHRASGGISAREDRGLEVTSELLFPLD
jgi:hypothetical protein